MPALLTTLLTAAWLVYLALFMAPVSRGDFLLAILRVTDAFRDGDLLLALTWPIHLLGGHIIFYERLSQLLNYYAFGYSPLFVKGLAIACWGLVGVAFLRLIRRSGLDLAAQLACVLLFAAITFNPIPYEVIAWPDSNVPYLSSLLAILFLGDRIVGRINAGRGGLPLALMCVLVIIGSGVGWAIIPAVVWLYTVKALVERNYRYFAVIGIVMAATFAGAFALIAWFPNVARLGLVTESLASLSGNLAGLLAYFLSLFGTLLGQNERPWAVWAGSAVFAASMATYIAWKRRHRSVATVEELLYLFGLFGLVLVSLGRWKLNQDRSLTTITTYYHLFALPAFYGFLLMFLRLAGRHAAWLGLLAALGIAAVVAPKLGDYHTGVVSQKEAYRNMIPAVTGWRMTEATRLIGSPFHNQDIFMEFLPALKEHGKYRSISGDFHPHKSSRIAPTVETSNGRICNPAYRNLEVFHAAVDDRAAYTNGYKQLDFRRFVGAARNGADCDGKPVSVSLVREDGLVYCRTWTTLAVYWHFDSKEHGDMLRSRFGYDFSCPIEKGTFFLVSQDPKGAVLESVRLAQ